MGLMARGMRSVRTIASSKQGTIAFNSPGVYYPKYGRISVTVQGSGTPGNAPVEPIIFGYNPDTPGTVSGYNPGSGGNYAGYNPGSGGNYRYSNPTYVSGYSYTDYYDNINKWHVYSTGDDPWGPSTSKPPSRSYSANGNYPGYSVVNYTTSSTTPGNTVYNPYTSGNIIYNPYTPGNPNYNPTVKGNPNYTPYIAGEAGSSNVVLGVSFPGGGVGQSAPLVAATKTSVPWRGQGVGVSIMVPPGGVVIIKES